jgi:hypothetical protein
VRTSGPSTKQQRSHLLRTRVAGAAAAPGLLLQIQRQLCCTAVGLSAVTVRHRARLAVCARVWLLHAQACMAGAGAASVSLSTGHAVWPQLCCGYAPAVARAGCHKT